MGLQRFAPTPATPMAYLTMQIISSPVYELHIMDVTSAFAQTDQDMWKQAPLYA